MSFNLNFILQTETKYIIKYILMENSAVLEQL